MPTFSRAARALLAAFALVAVQVHAQPYATKPLRWVVPFPPGSRADIVTRLYASRLSEALRQPVIVEKRAGAAGNVGAEMVARAAPDGYTLLTAPASLAIGQ